jgi:hypothetical protein
MFGYVPCQLLMRLSPHERTPKLAVLQLKWKCMRIALQSQLGYNVDDNVKRLEL